MQMQALVVVLCLVGAISAAPINEEQTTAMSIEMEANMTEEESGERQEGGPEVATSEEEARFWGLPWPPLGGGGFINPGVAPIHTGFGGFNTGFGGINTFPTFGGIPPISLTPSQFLRKSFVLKNKLTAVRIGI